MRLPRVIVVGLGPGDPSLVTAGTLEAIATTPVRYLRTARHPSASLVEGAATFDHHYDEAASFEEVYRRIVADLVAAADEHGVVLYAVPGSPRVLERTVDLLVAEAAGPGGPVGSGGTGSTTGVPSIEVEVVPALSFVDLAWVRLGVDPYEQGVRLIDGHRFEVAAAGERGPLLVAHCHNRRVLSDIKLAVDDPPDEPVVLLQRLGLPDELITVLDWNELDRFVEPDHLTSLYIPALAAPVAGEVVALVDLVATLRSECPWDAEQTHASLSRHLVEETYEVIEALDAVGEGGPDTEAAAYADLEEELGDLLFQIAFHSCLATEVGAFGLADVARGVHDKLVYRHPHVFGAVEVTGAEDVVANWEQIKKVEKGRASVFDGIPSHLPALLYALKVTKKAETVGVDLSAEVPSLDRALRTVEDLRTSAPGPSEDAIGDLILAAVAVCRLSGADPEAAVRRATDRLRRKATAIESD